MLTESEAAAFVDDGYLVLRQGVSADTVSAVHSEVWKRVGYFPGGSGEWPAQMIHIWESYSREPFRSAWSGKVLGVLDDLLGVDRYHRPNWLGYWPILFPQRAGDGFSSLQKFHIDGHHFLRFLSSPERALIAIFFFSEAGPDTGGTLVRVGSHADVARVLAEAGDGGMSAGDATSAAMRLSRDIVQVQAAPGDVLLMHPLLLHKAGPHYGDAPRVACNAHVELRAPMNISPSNLIRRSLVEIATIKAAFK